MAYSFVLNGIPFYREGTVQHEQGTCRCRILGVKTKIKNFREFKKSALVDPPQISSNIFVFWSCEFIIMIRSAMSETSMNSQIQIKNKKEQICGRSIKADFFVVEFF